MSPQDPEIQNHEHKAGWSIWKINIVLCTLIVYVLCNMYIIMYHPQKTTTLNQMSEDRTVLTLSPAGRFSYKF